MIIDVSRHNSYIAWPKVAAAGVTRAIIRATMGSQGIDVRFSANWAQSLAAGILRRGVYHYVTTATSPQLQHDHIMNVTGGDWGTEPLVLDVERTEAERNKMVAGWVFPKAAYTDMLLKLATALAAHGPVMIYTNDTEWRTMTTQPAWAAQYPLWAAAWGTAPPVVPSPWVDWRMWQYSNVGQVAGIIGNVDLSRENVIAPPAVDQVALEIGGHALDIRGLVA